jgi:signal transduction histidine kinase
VRSLVRLRVLQRELAERNLTLQRVNRNLEGTLHELQDTQAQLVHREKMASIGQLVAGIAHEINNPVNFIQGNLHFLEDYARSLVAGIERYEEAGRDAGLAERFGALREELELARILEDLQAVFDGCREGVDRTTSLVRDLRTFSRLDKPKRVLLGVHDTIDSTLNLLRGRLTGIDVHREYGEIPDVESFAGQLAQVFMNLVANAADALGDAGRVTVRTRPEGERVVVEVEDDGPGIEAGQGHGPRPLGHLRDRDASRRDDHGDERAWGRDSLPSRAARPHAGRRRARRGLLAPPGVVDSASLS